MYFNMIMTFMKWLLFLLLSVVECVIMLGEKRLRPSLCFEKQRRGGKPMRWNGGNLQSATLYKLS